MAAFPDLAQRFPSQTHKLTQFRAALQAVWDIPGDLAEFGVYNGGGTREMAFLAPERTVWAFDTFRGIPAEDYGGPEDADNPPGKWVPDADNPGELFAGIPNVRAVPGRFTETFRLIPPNVRFVLVHVDCDLYASHKQVFQFLERRMQPGGVILLDDPDLRGAHRAILEWCVTHPEADWDRGHVITWKPCPQPSAA